MSFIFAGCESLNHLPDISKWNIKSVRKITGLFISCIRIETAPDISKWNIKNITDISWLFCGCTSLKLIPDFSKWNTEKIKKINHMFSPSFATSSYPGLPVYAGALFLSTRLIVKLNV